jgi:excinuclease UvrABC nuclease subunit
MPFPPQTPRLFTKAAIEVLNPNQNGVYGIFRDGGSWIYVGRGDIRARLLSHVAGNNPAITAQRPTHFVTSVTQNDVALERQLILELNPVANQKVG